MLSQTGVELPKSLEPAARKQATMVLPWYP